MASRTSTFTDWLPIPNLPATFDEKEPVLVIAVKFEFPGDGGGVAAAVSKDDRKMALYDLEDLKFDLHTLEAIRTSQTSVITPHGA